MNQHPYLVKVGPQGQLTIPIDLREQLGISEGDQISLTTTAHGLLIESYAEVLRKLRGKYKTNSSAVTELLEERRTEANRKGY